jgi:hypothetical protein
MAGLFASFACRTAQGGCLVLSFLCFDVIVLVTCAGTAELFAADSELKTTKTKLTHLMEVELVHLQQELKDIQVCAQLCGLRKGGKEARAREK